MLVKCTVEASGYLWNQMPGLALRKRGLNRSNWSNLVWRQEPSKEFRFIHATATFVIGPEGCGNLPGIEAKLASQKPKEEFHEPGESNAVGTAQMLMKTLTETHEGEERRSVPAPGLSSVSATPFRRIAWSAARQDRHPRPIAG